MHLSAVFLLQLTVQIVSTLHVSPARSDRRAYLQPRGEPFRPERAQPGDHPAVPVFDPFAQPAPQPGNDQSGHGTDGQPVDVSVPGLTNVLHGEGGNPPPVVEVHGAGWPEYHNMPAYGFVLERPWQVAPDSTGNGKIPELQPPAEIRPQYQHLPVADALTKRKASDSPAAYSSTASNKRTAKRRQTKDQAIETLTEKVDKLAELTAQNQEANAAIIDQLRTENQELKDKIATLESQSLASRTAPVPTEFNRLQVSNGDSQQAWDLSEFSLPVGETSGGFTFGSPATGLDSTLPPLTDDERALFADDVAIFDDWFNFPPEPPPETPRRARRAQAHLRRGNNVGSTLHGQHNRLSRRADSSPPNMKDPAAAYQVYMSAYTEMRVNVSNLLVPYFTPILKKTNNTLIYDMLRSIHSDLTAYGPWTLGPYSNGHHCFDWIEDQLFGNITDSMIAQNETVQGVLADHAILIDIYDSIWGNASQIANSTGYLAQMKTLRGYLNPKNTSIIPASWMTVQPLLDSLSFDALYNKTFHH